MTEARVNFPKFCDFDHAEPVLAEYDAKSKMGPWGYMCPAHYEEHGIGLGIGLGQRLVVIKR